jgi:hypothetical protein
MRVKCDERPSAQRLELTAISYFEREKQAAVLHSNTQSGKVKLKGSEEMWLWVGLSFHFISFSFPCFE